MTVVVLLDRPTRRPAEGPALAEQVLAKSRPLLARQQYAAAISLMAAYVEGHGDDVEVRPLLAEAQMKSGRYAQAEGTIDDVLRRAPRMARALWLKGLLAQRRGADAMDFFRKAAQSPDASAEIWATVGLALLEAGDEAAAGDYLRRAREGGIEDSRTLGPLGELALRAGQFERAEQLLKETLATDKSAPRLWAMLAESQIKRDQLVAAAQTLADAVAACPQATRLVIQAARCNYRIGRYDQARRYVEMAAALSPDDPAVEALKNEIQSAPRSNGGSVE